MGWVGFMCVIIGLEWFRKFTIISTGWGGYGLDFSLLTGRHMIGELRNKLYFVRRCSIEIMEDKE
jgi:hypothetical protein